MDIVKNEQQPSENSEQHVKKEIAQLISQATGATYDAAYDVATAAYSPKADYALDLIYSSPENNGPLLALLATAQQSNPNIAFDIGHTWKNAGAGVPPTARAGTRKRDFTVRLDLGDILGEINDLDRNFEEVASHARQNMGGKVTNKAWADAGNAANEAKEKVVEAVAGKFQGK